MDGSTVTHISTAVYKSEVEVERRVNLVPYPGIDRRSLSSRGFHKNDLYGHRLEVAPGSDWLRIPVVLSRLQKGFCYFEADEELGRQHAEELVACFESSLKHSFSVQRQRYLHRLAKSASQAVYLQFGDNPGSNTEYLETVLIPFEPVVLGYQSPEHQITASPLVERCATLLGYDIVELRIGRSQPTRQVDLETH